MTAEMTGDRLDSWDDAEEEEDEVGDDNDELLLARVVPEGFIMPEEITDGKLVEEAVKLLVEVLAAEAENARTVPGDVCICYQHPSLLSDREGNLLPRC